MKIDEKFLLSNKFILPIVYVIIGVIIYQIIRAVMKKITFKKFENKKKKTIIALIKNILRYLIIIFIILGILDVYGVNTSGLIASIGVVGVIVGLAFQDMVADFLSGLLILFDNHYSIGDTVMIDGFLGEVVNFGLMTTKIKAPTGEVLILSNSSFKKVINYNMFNTMHYINIDVSYDTDIDLLEKVLTDMTKDVEKIDGYIGNYKLLGIQEYASSSIKYMVQIECMVNKRLQVRRDFNKLIRIYFNKHNIEIPYTKVDVNIRGKYE